MYFCIIPPCITSPLYSSPCITSPLSVPPLCQLPPYYHLTPCNTLSTVLKLVQSFTHCETRLKCWPILFQGLGETGGTESVKVIRIYCRSMDLKQCNFQKVVVVKRTLQKALKTQAMPVLTKSNLLYFCDLPLTHATSDKDGRTLVSNPARWSLYFILGPLLWSYICPSSRE